MVIWSLSMDKFVPKWAGCILADSILRPTSLSWIHTMTMEWLITYEATQSPLEWTKMATVGTILGRFYGLWERHFGANIGMNGRGEEVVLPSRALKYSIGV